VVTDLDSTGKKIFEARVRVQIPSRRPERSKILGFFFVVLGVQRRKHKKEIEKGEFLAEIRAHRAAQNAVQTTLFLNWFGRSSIYVQFKVD
jgi:hypothetical protein